MCIRCYNKIVMFMNKFLEGKKYIDLDANYYREYLENQYRGKGQPFIIDEEEYFVRKIVDEKRCYKELIADEILNVLGLPHVHYYLAKLFDVPCLISKSFRKDDLIAISGSDVLKKYNTDKKYDIDYMNNLDMITKSLKKIYGEMSNNLMEQINTLFCFDILFQNRDRKSDNWFILQHCYRRYDNKMICDEVNLAPIFDNERILDDDGTVYAMGIFYEDMTTANSSFDSMKDKIKNNNVLKTKLNELIDQIDENTFLECISKVENKIGCLIPVEYKEEFLKQYNLRFQQVRDICNSIDLSI